MILPLPEHLAQREVEANEPSAVWRTVRVVPVPRQSGHTSAVVPFADPEPPHSSHSSIRFSLISFSQPNAASSKLMVIEARMLSPCLGALGSLA